MRRLGWVVALLLVVATCLDFAYEVWLPEWRPKLSAGESFGVDVSSHQGAIDWEAVAASGIRFAYIKASEGSTYTDPDYARNVREAEAAGIVVGAYHYFSLCSTGKAQVTHFLSVANTAPANGLPPALDLELAGNCSARPAVGDVQQQVHDFAAAFGTRVVFYYGDDFKAAYPILDPTTAPLWLRSLYNRPKGTYGVWQASDRSRVPGIDGDVDLDVVEAVNGA